MLMPFGKNRGEAVENLQDSYVQWLWDNIELRGPLLYEIEQRILEINSGREIARAEFKTSPVKAAYRQMALKYHPDKGGNNEAMQIINEFYEFILGHNTGIKQAHG